MFIQIKKIVTKYTRTSKLKKSCSYSRIKTVVVFQCDSCKSLFERDQGKMDKQRISNHYFHVCADCNPKQFAQKKGVENRRVWGLSADSDQRI
jgi:hypothetical protein